MKLMYFSKKYERILYFAALGIMSFLVLYSVIMAASRDIFRDKYSLANTVVDIISLVFLNVLFGFSLSKNRYSDKSMRYFGFLIVYVFVAILFSSLANMLYGIPDYAVRLTVLESISRILSAGFFLALWVYQKNFCQDFKIRKIITILISLVSTVYAVLLTVNIFTPTAFVITEQGIFDADFTDYITIPAEFVCIFLLYISIIFSKTDLRKKLSFASCVITPVIFVILSLLNNVLNWNIRLVSLSDVAMALPLYIIFFNIYIEKENEIILNEKEQMKLQVAAAISQIQPHFLYNSLSVIAFLCKKDPQLATDATNTFAEYLRENMDFADKSNPIPFSEELGHIKSYVWLEKLRFGDRVKIVYNINCTDFSVPALAVQPIVENAIKHGVCKTKNGGTVTISSAETDKFYTVTVADTGVGFDADKITNDGRHHIGIESSRFRIEEMLGGSLKIKSEKGIGTTVTITIPKEKKKV